MAEQHETAVVMELEPEVVVASLRLHDLKEGENYVATDLEDHHKDQIWVPEVVVADAADHSILHRVFSFSSYSKCKEY